MKGVTVSTGGDKAENEVRRGVFSEGRPEMVRRRKYVRSLLESLNRVSLYGVKISLF